MHKMNCTHIVFIPKINKPQTVADYRLINLVNVISRIVSKVLANWLKLILLNDILDSQSAFVSNRLITNNTTIAFEGLHKMRNTRTKKKGQIQISKAYDRVEWGFPRKILLMLGIDDQWVQLAMEVVCIASY